MEMLMIEEIYLDLDGVCANFPLAVARMFLPEDEAQLILTKWTNDIPDIADLLGISKGKMWAAIDRNGTFWHNLELYPWTKELCKYLHTVTPEVYICTSPSQSSSCAAGKIEWMYQHKLTKHRNYFITPHKHKLAHNRAILVDDDNKKCTDFANRTGWVCQFPQLWNRNANNVLNDGRLAVEHKLDYVKERIQEIQEYIRQDCH